MSVVNIFLFSLIFNVVTFLLGQINSNAFEPFQTFVINILIKSFYLTYNIFFILLIFGNNTKFESVTSETYK